MAMHNSMQRIINNIYFRYFIVLTVFTLIVVVLVCVERQQYLNTTRQKNAATKINQKISFREFRSECNTYTKNFSSEPWPPIFVITPTYSRPEQVPELIKLSYVLKFVPNLHWIVSEDNDQCGSIVEETLAYSNLSYSHLVSPTPEGYKKHHLLPRGVSGRRAGLEWVQRHFNVGIVYFADDDNMFTVELFQEIRSTKVVSVFPVGLIGKLGVSSPVVINDTVKGFFDSWKAGRKFQIDMAGFAVRLELLQSKPNATMPYHAGYEEDYFLRSLDLQLHDLEPKANQCTRILVWHTKTVKNNKAQLNLTSHEQNTNLQGLVKTMVKMSMASV